MKYRNFVVFKSNIEPFCIVPNRFDEKKKRDIEQITDKENVLFSHTVEDFFFF
jgi:hypothetical protein